MSVLRSVKDRTNPYVQINKKVFDDPELSLKAKGFIGYCLSKPDHWIFYVSHLCSVLKERETAIYNVIKECIEHGYAFRWRARRSDGTWASWETIISDSKEEIIKMQESLSQSTLTKGDLKNKEPHFGNPGVEEHTLVNNEICEQPEESFDKFMNEI